MFKVHDNKLTRAIKMARKALKSDWLATVLAVSLLLTVSIRIAVCGESLNLVILPIDNPRTMYQSFLPLKHYLEKELSTPIQLQIALNEDDMIQRFQKNQVDIGFVCPLLYCKIEYLSHAEPLIRIRQNGKSTNTSVIVVREDSPIKWLADLKGRSFVYGQYNCATSGLLPEVMFRNVGLTKEDFFDIGRLGNDESAVYSVLAKLYDATGIRRTVADKYVNHGIRIIRESFPIPQNLFVLRKGFPQHLKDRVKSLLLQLNNDEHEDVLHSLGEDVDAMVPAYDRDYDIIRVMLKSLKNLDYVSTRTEAIKFGVLPCFSEITLFNWLQPVVVHLSDIMGKRIDAIIPNSFEDFFRRLEKGEFDFCLQNPLVYAKTKNQYHMIPLTAVMDSDSSSLSHALIITHIDNPIYDLSDISKRTIEIVSKWSLSGYYAQKQSIENSGYKWDQLHVVEAGTHERVLLEVYNKEVEIGAVSAAVMKVLSKDINLSKIRILARTAALPNWVLTAKSQVTHDQLKQMQTSFMNNQPFAEIDRSYAGFKIFRKFVPQQYQAFSKVR